MIEDAWEPIDQFCSSIEGGDRTGPGNPEKTIYKRFEKIAAGNTKV